MQHVEIRIEGCLDPDWAECLEGLEVRQTGHGETILTGPVADQSALFGLIGKLRDLGVKLLAISFETKSGISL
jgi:hypothetical protein